MEPVQHKRLSIILITAGVLLAAIGILLFVTSSRTVGVILLLAGVVLFLIGLPTMMLLSAYTAKQEFDGSRNKK